MYPGQVVWEGPNISVKLFGPFRSIDIRIQFGPTLKMFFSKRHEIWPNGIIFHLPYARSKMRYDRVPDSGGGNHVVKQKPCETKKLHKMCHHYTKNFTLPQSTHVPVCKKIKSPSEDTKPRPKRIKSAVHSCVVPKLINNSDIV